MSVQAMSRVMASSSAEGMARLVLLVMANRAGGDQEECFASVERIAFECRVDTRTVQRAVKRLVTAGDLVPAGVHPKHRTNVYRVMPVGVAESHPPVTTDTPVPPELKELGVKGSRSGSRSVSTNGSGAANRLANLLADLIQENGSKRPHVSAAWITEADRLLRLDKRSPDDAEALIRWSQSDPFWQGNILSMTKFRMQYDRLRLHRKRALNGRSADVGSDAWVKRMLAARS